MTTNASEFMQNIVSESKLNKKQKEKLKLNGHLDYIAPLVEKYKTKLVKGIEKKSSEGLKELYFNPDKLDILNSKYNNYPHLREDILKILVSKGNILEGINYKIWNNNNLTIVLKWDNSINDNNKSEFLQNIIDKTNNVKLIKSQNNQNLIIENILNEIFNKYEELTINEIKNASLNGRFQRYYNLYDPNPENYINLKKDFEIKNEVYVCKLLGKKWQKIDKKEYDDDKSEKKLITINNETDSKFNEKFNANLNPSIFDQFNNDNNSIVKLTDYQICEFIKELFESDEILSNMYIYNGTDYFKPEGKPQFICKELFKKLTAPGNKLEGLKYDIWHNYKFTIHMQYKHLS